MSEWLKERKKKIIVAVIVAALGAAFPALPQAITTPVIEAVYSIIDGQSQP